MIIEVTRLLLVRFYIPKLNNVITIFLLRIFRNIS